MSTRGLGPARLRRGERKDDVRAPGLAGLGSDSMCVAVKKLDHTSMQGQAEFLQEVLVLGGCRHANVLTLIGFSAHRGVGEENPPLV